MIISASQAAILQAKAHRLLRQDVSELLEPFCISMIEWALLGMIAKTDTLHLSEMAKEIGVEAPMITNLLNTLEKKGLITRTVSENDKRQKTLALTEAGQTLLTTTEKHLHEKLKEYFAEVSVAEMAAYLKVLQVIINKNRS